MQDQGTVGRLVSGEGVLPGSELYPQQEEATGSSLGSLS